MKKLLIIFLSYFLLCQLHAQPVGSVFKNFQDPLSQESSNINDFVFKQINALNAGLVLKPDSLFFKSMNDYFFDTYSYDSDWNEIEEVQRILNDTVWVNDERKQFTYDSNGNLISSIKSYWEFGEWVETFRNEYSYNEYGDLESVLVLKKYNDWTNYWLTTYSYDGNVKTYLLQQWQNGNWENYNLSISTYNENGLLISNEMQDYVNNAWVKTSFYTFSYDSENRILNMLHQKWENSQWANYMKSVYSYNDNGDFDNMLTMWWLSGDWVETGRQSAVYDGFHNKVSELYESKSNGIWSNNIKIEFAIEDGFVEGTVYKWLNDEWQESLYPISIFVYLQGQTVFSYYGSYIKVYYTDITGVNQQFSVDETIVDCFPNPASENIIVEIKGNILNKDVTFDFFNEEGTVIKEIQMTYSDKMIINVNDLPSGLYLMRTTIGELCSFKKIIITR